MGQTPAETIGVLADVTVAEEGLSFGRDLAAPVSVFFGDHRIWSFVPSLQGTRVRGGGCRVAWPASLLPYLKGRAEVSVRHQQSGETLFRGTVAFDVGDVSVQLVTSEGAPLAIDKGGHLGRTFAGSGEDRRGTLVDAVNAALRVLTELDVPAFLAFGCLLGAVRGQELIGHDNDADIAYLARATHPVDIILESLRLERQFRSIGWKTRRVSGGNFKLEVDMPGGGIVGCDVFTGFFLGEELFMMPNVRAKIPLSSLLPLSTVELEGRTVQAPADPPQLLEATYGEGWRVPDPSFTYQTPRNTRRLLGGLMRGERRHTAYWQEFYGLRGDAVPQEPSSFARWVVEQESQMSPKSGSAAPELVDIGSGTGRDSVWFASQGFSTLGFDFSRAGVAYAQEQANRLGVAADFRHLNLYDLRHVLVTGATLARNNRVDVVYARFLVHAMEDGGRLNLWRLSRSALLGRRGRLFLEFRTEATEHEFGEHFRKFVQPDVVAGELGEYGFTIEHLENRHGLAVHRDEDPRVCRIVARMG